MSAVLPASLAEHNYRREEDLQRACANWLRDAQGWGLIRPCFWFHTPNGGGRSRAEAGILKAMGVKAGVADLLFLWSGGWGAVELKAAKGSLSPQQKEFRAFCEASGTHFSVARSVADLVEALKAMGLFKGH